MGTIEIEVTQLANGKLRASPVARRGDTVTWIFKGFAQGVLKLRKIIKTPTSSLADFEVSSSAPRTVSLIPFPVGGNEVEFEYMIVDKSGKQIEWEHGDKG